MKKVVETRQVAHLWANKSQDQARNAGHNFYFIGPVLYSYNTHFIIAAHLENGAILWNDASYSVTTSKQQGIAWQSLNHNQARTRIRVPALDDNIYRNLDRIHREKTGAMPHLVKLMADGIIEKIAAMAGARYSGKIVGLFAECLSLEKNALALIEYARNGGRKRAKWPHAALPSELPADKDQREAWIRSMVKGRLIDQYHQKVELIHAKIGQIESVLASQHNFPYAVQSLRSNYNNVADLIGAADIEHKAAYGKRSAACGRLIKKLATLCEPMEKAVRAYDICRARELLEHLVRDAYLEIHKLARNPPVYRRNQAAFIGSKMDDHLRTLDGYGVSSAPYAHAFQRITRVADWHAHAESLKAAEAAFNDAVGYESESDRLRILSTARRHITNISTRGKYFEVYCHQIRSLNQEVDSERERVQAIVTENNKNAVADWIEGRRNSLPMDAGTYARIQGNEVVTSRGARVPLAHACRLVRIASRVIAKGGQFWEDGTGPQVGGFRVSTIFPDGGAVIGCHEFSAAESNRLIALLSACDACQYTDETIEA